MPSLPHLSKLKFQCRLATGFESLGCEPNAETLCIAVSLETLVFSETPMDLLVENHEKAVPRF
jgi:hypothetical protein